MRLVSSTIAALIMTAPTAGAAYSHPYPLAPTFRMSCAKIGSSAVADEKNVAKKSSSIVERISGDRKTKRSPSSAASHEIASFDVDSGGRAGTPRISSSATMTAANETALNTYAQPTFAAVIDRKSTRLNSSHSSISYAVFCLKKKNEHHTDL